MEVIGREWRGMKKRWIASAEEECRPAACRWPPGLGGPPGAANHCTYSPVRIRNLKG